MYLSRFRNLMFALHLDPQKHFTDFSHHLTMTSTNSVAILPPFSPHKNSKSLPKKIHRHSFQISKSKNTFQIQIQTQKFNNDNNNNNNTSSKTFTPFIPVIRGETNGEWEAASPTPSLPPCTSDAWRSHHGSSQRSHAGTSSSTTATKCSFRWVEKVDFLERC